MIRLISLLMAAACLASIARAQPPCEAQWLAGDGVPGVRGEIHAMLKWDPDGPGAEPALLIVGGRFDRAGEVAANNIAAWDGESWHALGEGFVQFDETESADVFALTVFRGELIAAGDFWRSGETAVAGIARWTGSDLGSGTWEPLDPEYFSPSAPIFTALLVQNDTLLAARRQGTFGQGIYHTRFYRWNGENWSDAASPLPGEVRALATYRGELYAGGGFGGGFPLPNCLARWDGSNWQRVGTIQVGPPGKTVNALTVYRGRLICAGRFRIAPGGPTHTVAAWDGTTLQALGTGIANGRADSLAVHGGRLVVGGIFTRIAGGIETNRIAVWDEAPDRTGTWSTLGDGFNPDSSPVDYTASRPAVRVNALVGYRGGLVAGGRFIAAGTSGVSSIAAWRNESWRALGTGFNAPVREMTAYAGELIAAGSFTKAGGVDARQIARWNGQEWRALGGGLGGQSPTDESGPPTAPIVQALAKYRGELIAAGDFIDADGAPAAAIARWNGSRWAPLGGGLANGTRAAVVNDLAVFQGKLIAAGVFRQAGDAEVRHIAQWNGTRWAELESAPELYEALALTVFRGELIVAVQAFIPGFSPPGLLRWDGETWTEIPLPEPAPMTLAFRDIKNLEVFNDELIVVGRANLLDGDAEIVRWDGETWRTLGDGPGIALRTASVLGGELWVGGPEGLARWDGEEWDLVFEPYDTLAIAQYRNQVFIGGNGQTAGGAASAYLARLSTGEPLLALQPRSASGLCIGAAHELSVRAATGYPGSTYQWRKDGAPIAAPHGTQRVLLLPAISAADAGVYDCIVANACGQTVSAAATLSLCIADWNCSGAVNGADVSAFYADYFQGAAAADINGDLVVDNEDVVQFIALWSAGCG